MIKYDLQSKGHLFVIIFLYGLFSSQSQSREIASLRTRNVELEGDVERLRRQLTSEKFERWVIRRIYVL